MPIPLPDLDDRTFDDLTAEAQALIPVLHPDWTDHNPSDPGIVLVELLAWLTEMVLFQVNQIPEANVRKFLELLGTPPSSVHIDLAIRDTIRDLHERYRAVTPADYEYLVRETWPHEPPAAALPRVRRVRCVPGRNLAAADPEAYAPAHVSVVVVPERGSDGDDHPLPPEGLTTELDRFLHSRRILTTRQHVVGPDYVDVGVSADLALREDAPPEGALDAARTLLSTYLDPLRGGPAEDGWPFGQGLHASEVYAVLERTELVDYVEAVELTGPNPIQDAEGQVIGVELDAHQLLRLARVDLVGYDGYGRTHPLAWTAP